MFRFLEAEGANVGEVGGLMSIGGVDVFDTLYTIIISFVIDNLPINATLAE